MIDDATLLRLRWRALLLDDPAQERSPLDVVKWFGALQGQDARQVEWAIGVRAPGLTRAAVRAELGAHRLVRTWVMRGTLHVVAAEDARWMLEHFGRRQRPAILTRLARAGLDHGDIARGVDALAAAVATGPRRKSECGDAVRTVLPHATNEQVHHLIVLAAHDALLVPEPSDGRDPSFASLDAVAPNRAVLDKAEAYATVAERFIRSHGPVTIDDLVRWAGITRTDARRAVAELGDRLATVTWNDLTLHLSRDLVDGSLGDDERTHLLPAFDEHIIGYANRHPAVPADHDHRIVPGMNGIYQPTIAHGGRTIGTWKASGGAVRELLFDDGVRLDLAVATAAWQRFDAAG